MRSFIGLFCVLALGITTIGCSGPAEDAPVEEAAVETPAEPEVVVEETIVVIEEPAAEEPVTEEGAAEEAAPEETVVETFDTEARPSLLLEIMLKPVTDAVTAQTSALPLPGL